MNKFFSTILAAAVLYTIPLAASANPIAGADGVLRFAFGQSAPPTITCAPFFVCDITLEPGEKIQNVAVGDSVRWVLSPATSGNAGDTPHVLIKPTDVNLSTNLIVTTDRRAYDMTLHSEKNNAMLRVGFYYPQNLAQAFPTPAPSPSPSPSAVPVSFTDLDFRYVATGEKKILPAHAFNDGKHMYLQFTAALAQMPVVVEVGPNGDQLVNYRIKDGTMYVVDGVPDRIALIVGSGKGAQRATIWRKI